MTILLLLLISTLVALTSSTMAYLGIIGYRFGKKILLCTGIIIASLFCLQVFMFNGNIRIDLLMSSAALFFYVISALFVFMAKKQK